MYLFLFFYLGAVVSVPYPGVTTSEGISESSKERPGESVSDALFCYLVSNMENGVKRDLCSTAKLHKISCGFLYGNVDSKTSILKRT